MIPMIPMTTLLIGVMIFTLSTFAVNTFKFCFNFQAYRWYNMDFCLPDPKPLLGLLSVVGKKILMVGVGEDRTVELFILDTSNLAFPGYQ